MNELYRHLLEAYKKHRQTVSFDDENAYEIYKWQLITACQGKTPIEIIRAHNSNPNKAEKGGFVNLIDVMRDNAVFKYLATNNPAGLQKTLDNLVDESISLNNRLSKLKSSMAEMLQGTNFNSKANDERTAATILTCHNPKKYTFYKNEIYQKFCAYLGESTQRAGKKYEHYLSLIEPLAEMISQDKELQSIIDNSVIANLLQSNLLIAQDVCWELLVHFPEKLKEICCIIANITWNSNDWKTTSLDKSGHSYVQEGGIAHESWNFDFDNKRNTDGKIYGFSQFSKYPKDFESKTYLVIFRSENKIVGFYGNAQITDYVKLSKKDLYNIIGDKSLSVLLENKIDDSSKRFLFGKKRVGQVGFNVIDKADALQILNEAASLNKNEDKIPRIINWLQNKNVNMNTQQIDSFKNLLKSTHNLILTGAPGTGKTYLAKKIAEAMGCTENEIGFVQFHPSYDYTDFVEGLRPINDENGNVGFERKDGVFKTFCAKALENFLDSKKSLQTLQQEISVRDKIYDFIQKSIDEDTEFETQGTKNKFHIIDSKQKSIVIEIPNNEKSRIISLQKSDLVTLLENNVSISSGKDIQTYFQRKYRTQQDSYTFVLYNILKNTKNEVKQVSLVKQKNFVFIIDEINRGEISKIFGELFFSIDPGYRGEKGRVQTQYQNIVEDDDVFKKGFFVPENVYIIGTMNDIDRSVESMDFAFRRRFAFKEIKANENTEILEQLGDLKDEAIQRMTNLNAAIEKVEGLSSAYHIGASYFLKVKDYGDDFGKLWEYHLEGLLREYLRGMQGVEETIIELKKAYDNGVADSNNGQ